MMDDTTLERGLRARPPADPVYRSRITATAPTTLRPVAQTWPPASPGKSRPMAGAARLIAVLAIVVLGLGALFLAAGQGPSPTPTATPVVSPSPTPWRPPPGFVTEEVEPGVLRVLSDGVRELTFQEDVAPSGIATGLDGSIWVFGDTGSFRLGDARVHEALSRSFRGDYEIGADGTLWVARHTLTDAPDDGLAARRGDTWTRYRGPKRPADLPGRGAPGWHRLGVVAGRLNHRRRSSRRGAVVIEGRSPHHPEPDSSRPVPDRALGERQRRHLGGRPSGSTRTSRTPARWSPMPGGVPGSHPTGLSGCAGAPWRASTLTA